MHEASLEFYDGLLFVVQDPPEAKYILFVAVGWQKLISGSSCIDTVMSYKKSFHIINTLPNYFTYYIFLLKERLEKYGKSGKSQFFLLA